MRGGFPPVSRAQHRPPPSVISGGGAPFNFYISASGDDSNDGSLGSPWSITALKTKYSTYRAKRVGIINTATIRYGRVSGTQTSLYSMAMAIDNYAGEVIGVEGGTASAQTYIATSDAAGNEVTRTSSSTQATIDGSDPVTSALPTTATALLGQNSYLYTGPARNSGYITICGLNITGYANSGIVLNGTAPDTTPGYVVKDCYVHGGAARSSADNPGGIFIQNALSPVIQNTASTDNVTNAGQVPLGMPAMMFLHTRGMTITKSLLNNSAGAFGKDNYQASTISYSVLSCGDFGSGNPQFQLPALRGCIPDVGQETYVHHCVLIGETVAYGGDGNGVKGHLRMDHNTFYWNTNATGQIYVKVDTGGLFSCTNSLFYGPNASGGDGTIAGHDDGVGLTAAKISSVDRNVYKNDAQFNPRVFQSPGTLTFSGWKAFMGCDANSIQISSSPYIGTPSLHALSNFAVTGAAATASSTGGPVGAYDSTGTVGPDWWT